MGSGLVVCGGKNWDDDVVESRCWGYSPCQLVDGEPSATWGAWQPRPSLPFPLSGGGSVVGGEHCHSKRPLGCLLECVSCELLKIGIFKAPHISHFCQPNIAINLTKKTK